MFKTHTRIYIYNFNMIRDPELSLSFLVSSLVQPLHTLYNNNEDPSNEKNDDTLDNQTGLMIGGEVRRRKARGN